MILMIMMMTMMMMTHLMDDGQLPRQVVQTVCSQAGLNYTLQFGEDLPEVTG